SRSDQVTRFKSTKEERAKIDKGLINGKNSPWVGKTLRSDQTFTRMTSVSDKDLISIEDFQGVLYSCILWSGYMVLRDLHLHRSSSFALFKVKSRHGLLLLSWVRIIGLSFLWSSIFADRSDNGFLVRVDQERIVKRVLTSSHKVLLLQSRAMKLRKLFQLAYDVHKCRMIPQLVVILEGDMCTSGNTVTNSRVKPSWREIVSLTFSEAGVLHVNWINFEHCIASRGHLC
nr:hypothetical protein [Tanacetum cinerariifolium]